MAGKNIVEIGFDYQQTQKEAGLVADALQKVLDLGNKIRESKFSFNSGEAGLGSFKKETDALIKSQNELLKQTATYTKILQEQTKQQILGSKATQESNKAKQQELKTEQESVKAKGQSLKYQQLLQREIDKKNKLTEKENKLLEKSNNEYEQLKAQYTAAANESKKLGAALIIQANGDEKVYQELLKNNKAYQQATTAASKYNAQLDLLETTIGQSQRRVGQYERSTFELTQVLREAPAFANSFATGISGISNNIPQLVDEFKRLRESTGSSFQALKILGGGLFSFTALLPIAFLAIQVYGKEISSFFKELFNGKETIDKVAESQRVLNAAFDDSSDSFAEAAKNIGELQTNVALAADGFLNKKSVVEQYNETMGKVTGTVKTFSEVEAKLSDPQVLKDYADAMLFRAAANLAFEEAAQKAIQAEKDRRKSEQEFNTVRTRSGTVSQNQVTAPGFVPGLIDPVKQSAANQQSAKDAKQAAVKQSEDGQKVLEEVAQDFQKKAADIFKKYNTDLLGKEDKDSNKKTQDFIFERNKLILEDTIKTLEAIASNELILFTIRNKAAEDANKKRIELINYVSDYEVKQEGVTANQIKLIRTQQEIDLRDATIKYSNDIQSILVSRLNIQKEISEAEKKIMDEATAYFEADAKKRKDAENALNEGKTGLLEFELNQEKIYLDSRLTLIATNKAKEEKIINEKYAAGKLSEAQYQKELIKIQVKYSKQALEEQIKTAEAELKLLKAQGLSGTDAADKLRQGIAEAQAALAKLGNSGSDDLAKLVAAFGVVNAAVQQLGSLLTSAANIGYTKQRNALQELEDQRQKNYESELARINASTLTEEQKADRIKILEAQRFAQKEEYDRKERVLAQRKARFEKAANIANIISAGALAVVKALPNIFLAVTAGALSAAQLAIAIATPIPTYADGLKGDKGDHYGIYGEAGAEYVKKPGQPGYIADKATLDFLPKGTKITPLGDDINEAAYRSMMQNTANVLQMRDMANKMQQANSVELMKWQTGQIIKGFEKTKTSVRVQNNTTVDLGWARYINKNIYGKKG